MASRPPSRPSKSPTRQPVRVLIIDDDEAFLRLTARRLVRSGMVAFEATSWADAIPHLRQPIDVCLLDLHLVSLNGARLCELLKKSHKQLKVILFSAADADVIEKNARQAGADGYLSKSLDHHRLVDAIGRVALGRQTQATRLTRPGA